ncbi:deoxyribodipyrimidine photolyase [Panacibacter sp. DH6]|uniref:Deoxyribodipyrimidine photolyase n=1 Tax=Panacibacter microcysteis TaxID=2793269 RepID=A0A931GVU7_9BACT|nr:FAD-binding domain-containing protein [Panacibacter microcysteis]MBG9376825.1 deoxyribodipyrimidine photolyase [Panacibacter microcysteis]
MKNYTQHYTFPTSYDAILEQLDGIKPALYARTRNFVDGSVTYLSPYISRGVISCRQVLNHVLKKDHKPWQIEKFIQELAWREYFQRTWQQLGDGIWDDIKRPQPDVVHHRMVDAVAAASTSINAIDEHIQLLFDKGYMHNHVRMYVASITCNIAKAHWLVPSKWLYYHLLDGDIASNTCSWQWVAGAFATKKYYCNQDNVNRYTYSEQKDTFLDKEYPALVNMPVPPQLEASSELTLHTPLPQTALPAIDISKPTFIYNNYNLDPQWHSHEDGNRILLLEPSHFEKYPVSKQVIDFILALGKNILGLQVYTGEMSAIAKLYPNSETANEQIVSKENPVYSHYTGKREERDWMFPEVVKPYSSFFAFWKKCAPYLKEYTGNQ